MPVEVFQGYLYGTVVMLWLGLGLGHGFIPFIDQDKIYYIY
jgi:hypothetical protein